MNEPNFELWLEFEHWAQTSEDDPEDEFFNMQISFADGRVYSLNVWTFKFLERARQQDVVTGENLSGEYLYTPDLFIEKLDRKLITEVVKDMIGSHGLKDEWLNRAENEEG